MELRTRSAPQRVTQPAPEGGQKSAIGGPVRRLIVGVVIGAATMLTVATIDGISGGQVPVLGSFAAVPSEAGSDVPAEPVPAAAPGSCLTWKRVDAADAKEIDCAQPHLFEQVGAVPVADQSTLPDDAQWRQLVNDRCSPLVVGYLNGRFDPDGRFRVGALKPSEQRWSEGDRELRCGLQAASRSGALYPVSGKVAEQDQSDVHEPGTCLGIDGRAIGDPVDCGAPHAVESAGFIDLSQEFKAEFPPVGDQDRFLQPACTKLATDYAGGAPVVAEKKLTVYWDNLTAESWAAGTRKVGCNLAALLPDRSGFAPVTGSVRGPVTVGDKPAPAAESVVPGAPAAPQSEQPPEESQPPPPPGPESSPVVPNPLPGASVPAPAPGG